MIFMHDGSENLEVVGEELGGIASGIIAVEQLLTPLTRFSRKDPGKMFAIDNGAFSRFDRASFLSLLEREWEDRDKCRFVALPDVVGSAVRTVELFEHWLPRLQGWRVALVCQDGQESLPLPWTYFHAIFIGGTTEWKMGPGARAVIKAAKARHDDVWVHVGRVNTPGRLQYCIDLGADSCDGSGLARYSWMRQKIHDAAIAPKLEFDQQPGQLGRSLDRNP